MVINNPFKSFEFPEKRRYDSTGGSPGQELEVALEKQRDIGT